MALIELLMLNLVTTEDTPPMTVRLPVTVKLPSNTPSPDTYMPPVLILKPPLNSPPDSLRYNASA